MMGSFPSREEREAAKRSRAIDYELLREKKEMQATLKLLLLGPGEVGKSTIVKQMRILHANGFSEEEYRSKTAVIYSVTIKTLITAAETFLEADENMFACADTYDALNFLQEVDKYGNLVEVLTHALDALQVLWSDQNFQKFFLTHYEGSIEDGNFHFVHELERICKPGYKPTELDLLKLRIPTSGVVEITFKIKDLKFRVIDVGGQKALRRKWIHAFENVNGLLFMAALSDYCLQMREDAEMNRLRDTMMLFKAICNSNWFQKSCVILFLNKKDLFAQKIVSIPLNSCFTTYQGSNTYEAGVAYIQERFLLLFKDKKKQVFVHTTCATDTNQMNLVLASCIARIETENIVTAGMA